MPREAWMGTLSAMRKAATKAVEARVSVWLFGRALLHSGSFAAPVEAWPVSQKMSTALSPSKPSRILLKAFGKVGSNEPPSSSSN